MLFSLILAIAVAHASVGPKTYAKQYPTRVPNGVERAGLERCLAAWGDHPFGDLADTKVRVIGGSVRVMGFGSSEPVDALETNYPQLVLIRPATSVLTRTTYNLRNPNGWYCMHTTTTVLAQANINLHCDAQLASSSDAGVAVLGAKDAAADQAVVVLGSLEVQRFGCTGDD